MRKLLSILLITIYLGASGGVVLYSHYCNELLTSVSLIDADAGCICPNHTTQVCNCSETTSDCNDCRSDVEIVKADIIQAFARESVQCPNVDFQYFTTANLDHLNSKTPVLIGVNIQNINDPPIPNYKEEAFITFCNILI